MANLLGMLPIPFLDDKQAQAVTVGAVVALLMLYGQTTLDQVVKPAYRR